MRFLAWAKAAFVTVAMLAGPAVAQTPDAFTLDLVYDVRVGGFRAFSASSRVRVDGSAYAIEASFHKEGIVAALSQTFSGNNRVAGKLVGGGVAPKSGFSLIDARSRRSWQVIYNADGTFSETHTPQMEIKPERRVSAEQKRGALDPLTAAVSGMLTTAEPCNRTFRVFDSRRRFDVEMRKVGTVKTSPGDAPGIEGDAVVCQAYVRKVAGYSPDDYDDDKQNRNPPKLYLAHIAGVRGWYPYRMEMKATFGDVIGRLATVTVKPLSESDRAAMRP
jgi:hypothetical protein